MEYETTIECMICVGISVPRNDDKIGKPMSSTKKWILGIGGCLGFLLMCVFVVGGATTFFIQQKNQMVISAKRTELKVNINGIRLSQLAYYQQYGAYVECAPYPRHPGKSKSVGFCGLGEIPTIFPLAPVWACPI